MVEDLLKVWPMILALVGVIALVVRIDALSKENAKKITTLFEMVNAAIQREISRKDK